jgi:hypothetical protein
MFKVSELKPNTFYTGRSEDGSDMQEFQGMHVSSCGNFWSNHPFTKQVEKSMRKDAYKKRIQSPMNSQFKQKDNGK